MSNVLPSCQAICTVDATSTGYITIDLGGERGYTYITMKANPTDHYKKQGRQGYIVWLKPETLQRLNVQAIQIASTLPLRGRPVKGVPSTHYSLQKHIQAILEKQAQGGDII